MRDLDHLQTTLDHLAKQEYRLHWGPGRHGPGHNIFTYHRDPDGNVIELFTQLDVMYDESKGYFEPRPWHEDSPQVPKSWEVDIATANSWGPVLMEALEHDSCCTAVLLPYPRPFAHQTPLRHHTLPTGTVLKPSPDRTRS